MISLENTHLGTFKEGMLPIPSEFIHHDSSFPTMPIVDLVGDDGENIPELSNLFAKQFVDSRTPKNLLDGSSEVTRFLGRASTSEPGLVLTTVDGKRTIVSIKTKPTGIANFVKEFWKDYQGRKEVFFLHNPSNPHGDERTDLIKREAFVGLGSHIKERQIMDAKNSLLLHSIGVKTRLPISGWELDVLMVWDEEEEKLVAKDVNWFKEQGFKDDELYQAAWGLSCPITLEDTNDFLHSLIASKNETDITKLSSFLKALYEIAKADVSSEYQELAEGLEKVLEFKKELSEIEIADILQEFGVALAKTVGKNYQAMYKNSTGKHYTHGALHDQNISFFGEWCDNFTLKEGLLEIGLAPENSADISGFILAMRKYSSLIMILRGKDPFLDDIAHQGYLDNVFLSELKKSWPSYDDYYQELTEAAVKKEIKNNREDIIEEISLIGEDPTEIEIERVSKRRVLQYLPIPL